MRLSKSGVVRGLSIASVSLGMVALGSVADAATATASCSSGGHDTNASATYSTSGSYHIWGTAKFQLTGTGTGGKSNETIRLRENGTQKWAWDSSDNLKNASYSVSMGSAKSLTKATEYVLFRTVFDVSGNDPACNAYTENV